MRPLCCNGGKVLPGRQDRLEVLLVSSFSLGSNPFSSCPPLVQLSSPCSPCSRPPPQPVCSVAWRSLSLLWCFPVGLRHDSAFTPASKQHERPHVRWQVCTTLGMVFLSVVHSSTMSSETLSGCIGQVFGASFVHKHVEATLILLIVQFSTMCSKTVLGYICQDEDSAVLLHFFPDFDVPFRPVWLHCIGRYLSVSAIGHVSASTGQLTMTAELVSTVFISVLLAFIRVSQWANVQSRACTCWSSCSP